MATVAKLQAFNTPVLFLDPTVETSDYPTVRVAHSHIARTTAAPDHHNHKLDIPFCPDASNKEWLLRTIAKFQNASGSAWLHVGAAMQYSFLRKSPQWRPLNHLGYTTCDNCRCQPHDIQMAHIHAYLSMKLPSFKCFPPSAQVWSTSLSIATPWTVVLVSSTHSQLCSHVLVETNSWPTTKHATTPFSSSCSQNGSSSLHITRFTVRSISHSRLPRLNAWGSSAGPETASIIQEGSEQQQPVPLPSMLSTAPPGALSSSSLDVWDFWNISCLQYWKEENPMMAYWFTVWSQKRAFHW